MLSQKAATLAIALAASAFPDCLSAQETTKNQSEANCGQFSWSVDRERAWFKDPQLTHRVSGARLRRIDRAVELALRPTPKVQFFLPPEKAPKADSYSGQVTFFGVPKPGLYQITLSDDAAIDVFENGARLEAMASTSGKDCPGIGRSVRFNLAPGDLVLVEISGAATNSIKAAFAEAR